jgi:four helix bundle protein
MDNREFAKDLEKRTRDFAVRMIRLSANLPNTAEARVVKNQITKSATSIGANYREANRSRSKPDFKNKIEICASEASETQYWLEIVAETQWIAMEAMKSAYEECSELLAIFTAIARKCSFKNS